MKRLTVLLATAGSLLSLALPGHAAGDASYTGTMTYANPVTPIESPNEWTFSGTGSGTLRADEGGPSQAAYSGPLSLDVKGYSANESTLGGDTDIQIVSLKGVNGLTSATMVQPSPIIRTRRVVGSPIVVTVPVNVNYCNQFGCITVYQCVRLTITYSTWPYPSASATTSKC